MANRRPKTETNDVKPNLENRIKQSIEKHKYSYGQNKKRLKRVKFQQKQENEGTKIGKKRGKRIGKRESENYV